MPNKVGRSVRSTSRFVGYATVTAAACCALASVVSSNSLGIFTYCSALHLPGYQLSAAKGSHICRSGRTLMRAGTVEKDVNKMSDMQLRSLLRKKGLSCGGSKRARIERYTGGLVTPTIIPPDLRASTVTKIRGGNWKLTINTKGGPAAPPQNVTRDLFNPLRQLGECGDKDCSLCRLKEGFESTREEFLDFACRHIGQYARSIGNTGINYCSLGSGFLYFDWELVERLRNVERVNIKQVLLVDLIYDSTFGIEITPVSRYSSFGFDSIASGTNRSVEAKAAFAGWFPDVQVRAFSKTEDLADWVERTPEGKVDVLMQMDARDTNLILEDGRFPNSALRFGAMNLRAEASGETQIARFEAYSWMYETFKRLELVQRLGGTRS